LVSEDHDDISQLIPGTESSALSYPATGIILLLLGQNNL